MQTKPSLDEYRPVYGSSGTVSPYSAPPSFQYISKQRYRGENERSQAVPPLQRQSALVTVGINGEIVAIGDQSPFLFPLQGAHSFDQSSLIEAP
jgi:hypothetical protein